MTFDSQPGYKPAAFSQRSSSRVKRSLLRGSDPRWLPFLRKLGKAPDQLAQIKFKVTVPQ
jgi:hypothetical protein